MAEEEEVEDGATRTGKNVVNIVDKYWYFISTLQI